MLVLLKQNNVPVVKASIGNINKTDIISAKANLEINELDALIVGFNVSIDEEAKEIQKGIKIFTDDVIYKLIENINEFRMEKRKEIEKKRLFGLSSLCKLKVLHKYVFRNTKPAIFGVKIEVGKINQRLNLIDEKGEKVGRVKNIQSENKSVEEATEEMEVAVSIPGINFERQMKSRNFIYSDISETQFKNLKKNKDLLSQKDIKLLEEIAEIKRQEKADWGF
jgi:translation initiation factor 5B